MDETQALDCTQALDDWINEDDDSNEHSLVAWLEVDGRRHDVHLGETKIGRDPETCQIVLHNKVLSKQHAVFEVEGDIHTIADLGSMNKTRIGKMILKPNVRFALQGGESLRFGDVQAKYIIKPKIQNQDSGSETESEPMFSLNDSEEKPTSPVSSHHLSDFIPETPAATKTNSAQIDSDSKTFVPESPSASQNTHTSENHTKLIVPESPDNISAVKNVCEEKDDSFFDPSQLAKEKHVIASYKDSEVQPTHATTRCEDFKIREYNSDVSTDVEDDDVPTQLFSEPHDNAQKDLSTTNMELSKNKENTLENNEKDMSDSGISMSRDTNTKSTDDDQSGNSNVSAEIEDIFNQPTQVYPVLDKSPKVTRNTEYTDEMSPSVQNEATDSTQDIMNAFDLPVVKSNAKSQNIHDDDDVPTQLFFENEESAVFKKPFAMAPKTKKNLWDEIYNENVNANILEAATQQFSSDDQQSRTVCNNDNIFVAPTLPFDEPDSSYKFQLQSKSVQKKKCGIGIFDDIFSQPTQLYSDSNTDTIDEDNIPTQYFDPAPKEELINKEDKQVEQIQSDDELDIFNEPTQVFSTPKPKTNENCGTPINRFTNVYLSGKKGTGGKKSMITSLNLSPVSVRGQDNACDDDDDDDDDELPPTQLFTEPSTLNKSPVLKVDTTPTQSILQVTKKTNASCAGTLKESEASAHVEDSDYDAPTQIFKEKSINEDLNECDAPTQLFTDIYDKVSDNTPQELIPGESNNSSIELPKGISQTWALLDADETQDLSLDGGLAIDKPCLDTQEFSLSVEKAGECKNIDIHDSSSDVSENLLDDRQAEGENDGIPLSSRSENYNGSSSASDDASHSTDSKKTGASLIEKERKEEIILKDGVVDNLHLKQQDMSKTSAIAENESYNSDESTDIESELVVSDILEHTSKVDVSHGSEMSKLELSSDSNVQGNKDCITPSSTASLLLSPKNLNDMASTESPLTKNQELHREAKVKDNEKYQFKCVSRMFPVTLSSETLPSSQNQSTQDSSPLIDMSFANISILDSEPSTSQETASDNLQNLKNEKKLSNLGKNHAISDSDSEDGVCEVSQNLFDLPLEHNQGEIQNKHKENVDNSEDKASEKDQINETPKRGDKITETPKGEDTINESPRGEDKMNKTSVGEDKVNDTLKEKDKINETPKGEDKIDESPKEDKIYETSKEEDKLEPHKGDGTLNDTLKGEDKINESPKREGKINESPKREGKINECPKREGKINESPKRKTTKIHSETGKSEVEAAEGNIIVQDYKKSPEKRIEKKVEQNAENTSGEEIDKTVAVSTKDESTCESNSRIDSSLSFTPKTRKKQNMSVDMETFSISNNRSPDLNCIRKSKRKIEYNDELFNNSKGSDSFIGFNESPTKKEKNLGESEDRLKNKRENEKSKYKSKTAPQNITETCLKEDSNHLPEIIVGRTSTAERLTTSISDGVRDERIVNNKDSGTKEVSKQQFTGHHTRSKDKENEKSLPVREKRKRGTAKANSEEENVVDRRTRTKSKELINESLSRESSTCRDSAVEVTIDDVQNVRRSGRRRQNSDSSTVSNLSILSVSSNRNVAKSAVGTSNTLAESVAKGRLDQSCIKDESKPNMSTQRVVENGKKVRMSKRSLSYKISDKIDDEKHEEPNLVADPSTTKVSDKKESSRSRTNRRYKSPDLPVTEVSTNKSRTKTNKKEDSDVKVTIEIVGVKNKKPEIDAELNEPESSAQGRLNSSRIRRAPKRFSCDGNITDVTQGASTRSSRTRKAHTLETLQEPVETLPAKRGRRSAMPNLNVPTVNDEEVEITLARQNSTQKRNVDVDDSKNKNDTIQIHRRGCRSTTAKSMPLLEKDLSLQETNIQLTKVKASGTSCKTRASIATSNLATKADPVVCKKTRNSMIAEKTKSGDRDSAEVKYDAGSSRSSSQSSEDSKVCQRSKRKRGADNSTDQLLSSPKSSRSGRSRLGSPSLKDSILWSPSQRQQQASTKPRVLFTGYKDANDEKIVISFGGTVVESPRDCTVLVTVNIRRTCKLLAVIGRGLPIVSPAWLAASKRARNFVDPWEYLVKDSEAEEKYGFQLDQSLRSASRVLLFEGLSLHATHSVKPPPDQMKEIIECSGGEYLDMPPKKYAPQVRIVSCTEDERQWTSFKHLGIPILGTEFILTGLLRHELLLDEFQLG